MNPFVFACITPHGSEVIPELSPHDTALMARTRASMQDLGARMTRARPDVLIVLTPHGLRVDGQFSVTDCERVHGSVSEHDVTVTMERSVDRAFARAVADEAQRNGLPVATVNYAVAQGPLSCLPLDWGALVPLHFMPPAPVVIVTPPRGTAFAQHVRFGQALARAARASGKRVGLIASCDWSHTHAASGPYGYHEAAAQLDAKVVQHVRNGTLEGLAEFDSALVEHAKPDGLWQALVLAGAVPPRERRVEFLSYEVPTYFGLVCAALPGGVV